MGLKVTNNAYAVLNASITSTATTIVLVAGQGARFPTLSAGDYFYATLIDTSNNLEIVKCTARSTDTLTVVRGQDSTTARAYATNDRFELRPTAVLLTEVITAAEGALPKAGGAMTGSLEVQASWRLGTNTNGTGGGSSAPYAGGLGGGFNPNNNIYSMYVRDRTDTYWNDVWLEAKTISLKSGSGGYNSLVADTSGRIAMPQQPAFNVCNTGSVSANIWTYNTTNLNRGSHMNLGNGRFTAPIAGVYFFTFGTIGTTSHGDQDIYLSINGTFLQSAGAARPDDSGAWASMSPGTGVINLSVGDYVQVYSTQTNAYSDGNCWLHFRGFFIG